MLLGRLLHGARWAPMLNRHNLMLLETFHRYEWLYRAPTKIPHCDLHFEPPKEVSEEDIALCERLVASYRLAGAADTSGMWAAITAVYHQPLRAALESGAEALARLLARMFREKFMLGIASGVLHADGYNRLSARLWSLKALAELASLAEYFGVVPVDSAEQGTIAAALAGGPRELVERIENAVGFPIDHPRIGAPHGIEVAGRLVTSHLPEHLYVACRASALAGETPDVVEIGGGYGGTAYWFMRRRPQARYTIYDLPVVGVLQGYFLARTLGTGLVSFMGEDRRRVAVLPCSFLEDRPFDLLLNENSMPEIPVETVGTYLRWASSRTRFFYSYNQEACAPYAAGALQLRVPDVVRDVGGFVLISRSPSWMGRGYVEEVYAAA